MMGMIIIITPFWSAITEAWAKKEFEWIKTIMKKLLSIWWIIVVIGIFMLIASPWIYKIWIGKSINIPFTLSALVIIWVITKCWNGIFSHFLNGTGKINMQLYISILVAFINIPTAIVLGHELGIIGILISNCIFAIFQAIIAYIQYSKLINFKAFGLWNK